MKKERLSNIELLRCIAMFLVLVVHADFHALHAPTHNTWTNTPVFTIGQYFFESVSIICVNLFILISGWFGIHPTRKSFFNFIFQCFFFYVGIYIAVCLLGITSLSTDGLGEVVLPTHWNWFIRAYLVLYLLAPMINSYIEHTEQRKVGWFLIFFFSAETLFSFATKGDNFFEQGYTPLSFIGLYALARYVHLYPHKWNRLHKYHDLLIFSVISLTLTVVAAVSIQFQYNPGKLFRYDNPLVIASALYLFLFFSKLNIKSSIINWVATSTFAVFLLHLHPELELRYFVSPIREISKDYDGILCLATLSVFLTTVFLTSILIDKIRIICWNKIYKYSTSRLQNSSK